MYKITLYDWNCNPICDGVTKFFVDTLEEFEYPWMENPKVEELQKARFQKSKQGNMVTDYYTNYPEYNIVQRDSHAKIIWEKEFFFEKHQFTTYNAYHFSSIIYAKQAYIKIRFVKFENKYFLMGKYKLEGVCKKNDFNTQEDAGWTRCDIFGNPIHIAKYASKEKFAYCREKFEEDSIETYCWVTLRESDTAEIEKMEELSEKDLANLLKDIPGEGG